MFVNIQNVGRNYVEWRKGGEGCRIRERIKTSKMQQEGNDGEGMKV
jgi:hypothetical protein